MKCTTNCIWLLFCLVLIAPYIKQSSAGKSLNKMKCTVHSTVKKVFDLLCDPYFPYTVPDCTRLRESFEERVECFSNKDKFKSI
ncbi:hypothetical protein NPIL_589091 [Nephila pilipes]|uniref:Venom protein n=1 Tax=Nephila pilipes TaxID=299642 RepID=A0A8X6TQL2_NEPPI|nr:hypothetical protein NPIL_589091 [Nephila pilipes]